MSKSDGAQKETTLQQAGMPPSYTNMGGYNNPRLGLQSLSPSLALGGMLGSIMGRAPMQGNYGSSNFDPYGGFGNSFAPINGGPLMGSGIGFPPISGNPYQSGFSQGFMNPGFNFMTPISNQQSIFSAYSPQLSPMASALSNGTFSNPLDMFRHGTVQNDQIVRK